MQLEEYISFYYNEEYCSYHFKNLVTFETSYIKLKSMHINDQICVVEGFDI